ncbi:hypothetical protein Dimus_000564 [Dionaea muscipula]
MEDNGLSNMMDLIKRQRWEKLFKRREFVHVDAVKEFYARMTLTHLKKKDVVKTSVRGVVIEFDHLKLASILGIPGNNGICEYIKDVWEESKYKATGNNKKNVVPRFGKRDTSSFMDLTYMDHLMSRRLVNLLRVMIRHMSYVISMKDHELPYGDWLTMIFEEFGVPLVDKKGEELKRYDYFEETFLTMWTGENRRRDDDNEAPAEEVHEEEEAQNAEFDWEAVIGEVADQGESGSGEKFYDAEDEIQEPAAVVEEVPAVVAQASAQQKKTETAGVDPSGPSGLIPEYVMNKLQAEFERARANRFQADLEKAQAENAGLLSLLQQAQSKPKP